MKSLSKFLFLILLIGLAFAACDVSVDSGSDDKTPEAGDGDVGDGDVGDGDVGDGDAEEPYTLVITNSTVGFVNVTVDGVSHGMLEAQEDFSDDTTADYIEVEYASRPDKITVSVASSVNAGVNDMGTVTLTPASDKTEEELNLYLNSITFSLWNYNTSGYEIDGFGINDGLSTEYYWDLVPNLSGNSASWLGFFTTDVTNIYFTDTFDGGWGPYSGYSYDENEVGSKYLVLQSTAKKSASYSASKTTTSSIYPSTSEQIIEFELK